MRSGHQGAQSTSQGGGSSDKAAVVYWSVETCILSTVVPICPQVRKASGLSGLTIFDQAWALIGDGVWTGSYHIRHLVLLLNDRAPTARLVAARMSRSSVGLGL